MNVFGCLDCMHFACYIKIQMIHPQMNVFGRHYIIPYTDPGGAHWTIGLGCKMICAIVTIRNVFTHAL